jgi:hypothetical protein
MDAFTHAINTLLQLLVHIGDLLVAALVAVELWLRGQLATFGLPPAVQTVIMLALAALLIVGSLRLFGGLIRLIVLLVLVLIAIHILLPVLPH